MFAPKFTVVAELKCVPVPVIATLRDWPWCADVGAKVAEADTAVPLPERPMIRGFGVTDLVTVIAPVIVPTTVGAMATFNVQNFLLRRVDTQLLPPAITKSPDGIILLSEMVALVSFVILMALVALVVPTACAAYFSLAGLAVIWACPVPLRSINWGLLLPVYAIAIEPSTEPTNCGANVMLIEQVPFAGIADPRQPV